MAVSAQRPLLDPLNSGGSIGEDTVNKTSSHHMSQRGSSELKPGPDEHGEQHVWSVAER